MAMHGYKVVDVVEVHRPGSPAPPAATRSPSKRREIDDMTAIWRVLRPWLSSLMSRLEALPGAPGARMPLSDASSHF